MDREKGNDAPVPQTSLASALVYKPADLFLGKGSQGFLNIILLPPLESFWRPVKLVSLFRLSTLPKDFFLPLFYLKIVFCSVSYLNLKCYLLYYDFEYSFV